MKARTNARPAAKHPKDVALLVIDVQQGLFAKSIPIYHADELSRISARSLTALTVPGRPPFTHRFPLNVR
jgi:hypothetical protein